MLFNALHFRFNTYEVCGIPFIRRALSNTYKLCDLSVFLGCILFLKILLEIMPKLSKKLEVASWVVACIFQSLQSATHEHQSHPELKLGQ